MTDQATERIRIRQQRQKLSASQRRSLSRQMCQRLKKSAAFRHSHVIASYLPTSGEIEPTFLERHFPPSKRLYYPVIDQMGHRMFFVPAQRRLRRNRFGISEPVYRPGSHRLPKQIDLALVPLVGFDRSGNRIGAGGGYYDHSFRHRNRLQKKPLLVGLAYDFQELPAIIPNPWDVKLDAVITESRILLFR